MKHVRSSFLSLTLILALSFASVLVYSYGQTAAQPSPKKIDLWFVLRLRDYETDMPISNTSITTVISTGWGERRVGPLLTNETGIIQVYWGNVVNLTTPRPSTLTELVLSNNHTVIKVFDLFMEDVQYTSDYVANRTRYTGMRINLVQKNVKNQTYIEVNLWALKGKLIKVSDRDPITGVKATLSIKPAAKAALETERGEEYKGYYFFPLNYEVNIIHLPALRGSAAYPTLRVRVMENTTFINWMYHAFEAYVSREVRLMDAEVEWFSSSGSYIEREVEEYQGIKNLWKRVLDLYEQGEFGPALGGSKISANRLSNLKWWFSSLKSYSAFTSIGIALFAYGLASLLPIFVFEEPSQNKLRLLCKVLMFALLMVVFSLTHPSLKISYALLIQGVIGAATPKIDPPLALLGSFIIGSATYFFITLILTRKAPMRDLALQLGMRSLKRRLSRTTLTLITITVIVSSAIIFVNVSATRATRVRGTWRGTDIPGVIIQPDVSLAPLSEYDVNWTRKQDWGRELGYRETIVDAWVGDNQIIRDGVLIIGATKDYADIIGIDPAFTDKYYNLSTYVRGFWQEFVAGNPVVILPTTYEVPIGDFVTLGVDETIMPAGGVPIPLGVRSLGSMRVVGKFDPAILSRMTKIDGTPLFRDTLILVLVPIKAIVDPAIAISEATIMLNGRADPVNIANELAFMLGVSAIANSGGLAMMIEWSLEVSVVGWIPYLFPLVIAGLMVYITMASIFEERRREYAMLATLGLDPKNTFNVFIVEAFLLGLMGTLFGFFGSYIIAVFSSFLASLMPFLGLTLSASYGQWSAPAILVALFTGVVMVFLGAYLPAARAQNLSLMGRVKKRQFMGEFVSVRDTTSFVLPIKENIQNAELLYTYVRETIGKFRSSLVDSHSVKGEIRRDGSFAVSFVAIGPGQSVLIPCEVKGVREGENLVPLIEFPTGFKDYTYIRDVLRDLEEYMIGFSTWKEMQLKMKIVRETPRKRKTLEEILAEIRDIIAQIKDSSKKLKILEAQKGQLSEDIYNEFRQKYIGVTDEKSKVLRSMVIGLEPYHHELHDEIKKIEVQVERITTAYNLGEINEEEYVKTGGPMQGKLVMLKNKVKELEEIFDFIEKPAGIF